MLCLMWSLPSQFGLWPTRMTFIRLVSLDDAILFSRKNCFVDKRCWSSKNSTSARNATIDSGQCGMPVAETLLLNNYRFFFHYKLQIADRINVLIRLLQCVQ